MTPDEVRNMGERAVAVSLRRWPAAWRYRDDMLSDAYYGIALALASANEDRSPREIAAFCWRRATGSIMDGYRTRTGSRRLDAPEAPVPLELVPDPACTRDEYAALEAEMMVREGLAALPAREEHVLRLLFLDGAGQQDVADDLGVTASRVSQIKREALRSAHQVLDAA